VIRNKCYVDTGSVVSQIDRAPANRAYVGAVDIVCNLLIQKSSACFTPLRSCVDRRLDKHMNNVFETENGGTAAAAPPPFRPGSGNLPSVGAVP